MQYSRRQFCPCFCRGGVHHRLALAQYAERSNRTIPIDLKPKNPCGVPWVVESCPKYAVKAYEHQILPATNPENKTVIRTALNKWAKTKHWSYQ